MRTAARLVLAIAAAMSWALPARAQGFYWSLTYEPSIPVGGIRNSAANVSPSGAGLGARILFTDRWSLGVSGHWNEFAENHARTTYQVEDGAFTGALYRRVWTGTLLGRADLYLAPDAPINPYVSVGAGYTWMSNELLASDLAFQEDGHGVTVSPETGILIAFDRDPFEPDRFAMQSVIVGLRYTFSAAKARDVSDTSFLGLTLGLLVY